MIAFWFNLKNMQIYKYALFIFLCIMHKLNLDIKTIPQYIVYLLKMYVHILYIVKMLKNQYFCNNMYNYKLLGNNNRN